MEACSLLLHDDDDENMNSFLVFVRKTERNFNTTNMGIKCKTTPVFKQKQQRTDSLDLMGWPRMRLRTMIEGRGGRGGGKEGRFNRVAC